MIPDELRYTAEHEWVRPVEDGRLRIGITHYAQDALGDVVFVSLPETGAGVSEGQAFGEVESTKSVSEIYAPVAGKVVAVNQTVSDRPEVVNEDPYGEGWLVRIRVATADELAELLDAGAYRALLAEQ